MARIKQQTSNFDHKVEIFKAYLHTNYPEKYDQIVDALSCDRITSFRINNLKVKSPDALLAQLKEAGSNFEKGPLLGSYVLLQDDSNKTDRLLSKTLQFNNFEIYIQDLSSMLAVYKLDPKPNQKIMDLCAAPGSKTTLIADITQNSSEIWAVERSRPRFFMLKSNLEKYGATNVHLSMGNAVGIERNRPEFINFFDRVLVDALCTNEGMFDLRSSKSLKFWNPKKYKSLIGVQKGLIATGLNILKPGGTMVYSTCTFNPEEGEKIVSWLQEKNLGINIESQRVFPDKLFSGFFIAKITKPELY